MNAIDFPDHILEEMWKRTDWKKAEQTLSDQQEELSRMALMHKHDEVLKLQQEIVGTLDNKMLIESFYASIQHKWLMQHLPMDKDVLSQFLSVGIVDSGELFPDDGFGISEASNISPYIGNFMLDGLQSCG